MNMHATFEQPSVAGMQASVAQAAIRTNGALEVPPVTAQVREPNDRLLSILLSDRPMTALERAYVELCEGEGR